MKPQVLLIDDDAAYRKSIKFLFRNSAYQLLEADGPSQGITLLNHNRECRVILLDLQFNQGEPATLILDFVQERPREYRVIVLTAHDDMLPARRADQYAVFNYLPKADRSSNQAIRFSVSQAFKDLEKQHLDAKVACFLAVQRAVTCGEDNLQTLQLICQSIVTLTGAYTCHIRLYDFAGGDYHLAGFAGPDPIVRRAFQKPKAKGALFSGKVVESGTREMFADLQSLPDFQAYKEDVLRSGEAGGAERAYWDTVRSAYIAPIGTGLLLNGVDAVLNVSSDNLSYFDPRRCEIIDEFVNLASISITKDWLEKKREEIHRDYTQISETLGMISDTLKEGEALQRIYRTVTQRISTLVNAEVVSLFLFDSAVGRIVNVEEVRAGRRVEGQKESYVPGQSLTGSVFETDATIQLPDPNMGQRIAPLDDLRYDHANKEGYLSNIPSGTLEHYLGVPIRIEGKPRGVLRAMNKRSKYYDAAAGHYDRLCLLERGFSTDCRNVLEITARHLAVAISNAELLAEKEQRVQQIRLLAEVGRLINSALELNELFRITIEKMAEVMRADACMVFLKNSSGQLVLKQCYGIPFEEGPAPSCLDDGVLADVALTGRSRRVGQGPGTDGPCAKAVQEYLRAKDPNPSHMDSQMMVPIIARGDVLGVMTVANRGGQERNYGQSDLELFKIFADYVAVAIINAHIHESERTSARSLSLLVAAVAHEINNTSGLIPANIAAIKARLGSLSPEVSRMLSRIDDAAGQATEFANEIAGFSAKRSGKREVLDINHIVSEAIGALDHDLTRYTNGTRVDLTVSLATTPLLCELYKTPFIQIVRNVVINAYQALQGKVDGRVELSTSPGVADMKGFAVLHITDNGPGITPEDQPRIFDPDFTTKPKGNGIGLWLVRKQLDLIGGKIDVVTAPHQGAHFVIRVPMTVGEKGG